MQSAFGQWLLAIVVSRCRMQFVYHNRNPSAAWCKLIYLLSRQLVHLISRHSGCYNEAVSTFLLWFLVCGAQDLHSPKLLRLLFLWMLKIQYKLFHVPCNGLCCWMTPAAEHLDCNCFPGPLICSELLNSAGGALRAAWVPAGQAGWMKLSFPGKTALQFTSASELGDGLNI